MSNRTIIAIDPGASGAIALRANNRNQVVKMPKTIQEMSDYFNYVKETYNNVIVFIEKVQAYGAGDDTPGKKFGINKMLKNYEQLLTVIKLTGFEFVEVYPISWQSTLGLKIKKEKGQPKETKTERKNRYKHYAGVCFPEFKVTLATADALCILQFAFVKFENNPSWIVERLQNVKKNKLIN